MAKGDKIKVGILCLTYQHESYIQDALRGFVTQEVDFPYWAVVVDDGSKDKTAQVIEDFMQNDCDLDNTSSWHKEDDRAVYTFATHKTNRFCSILFIHMKQNSYESHYDHSYTYLPWLKDANYIAFCEGDDYWTDPCKLSKQVAIMDKDETLMGCATNYQRVTADKRIIAQRKAYIIPNQSSCRITLRDFFKYNISYPTPTVLHRNAHAKEIMEKLEHMANPYLVDWTLWIALHCFGDFYYLDEVTAAYRQNPTSITHTLWVEHRIDKIKYEFNLQPRVADVLPPEYADIAAKVRNTRWVYRKLIKTYIKELWHKLKI